MSAPTSIPSVPSNPDYQIIATQGEGRYVLVPAGDANPRTRFAQILDTDKERLYPPQYLQTILAQGYWNEYTGDQSELQGMLQAVGIYEPTPDGAAL